MNWQSSKTAVKAGKPLFVDSVTKDLDLSGAVNKINHYYNVRGELDSEGNYAQREEWSNGVEKFYLRVGTRGAHRGFLMEPYGIEFHQGDEKKYVSNRGQDLYAWQQVSQQCFKYYLEYLKTRNKSLYTQADRIK